MKKFLLEDGEEYFKNIIWDKFDVIKNKALTRKYE